ncbi:OLC1v1023087C1 [Oldenlandia corymbosa var. corymbosa]|uniref:OLC1v1023087C1 n=1 Tax=Oldenlandia corymbosa var. corymbosa TaxID=529605 RepID=A0AAV1C0L3_OLDCO|nr:OLC1v1023087C1 [Oldenlandia corymbosa var. corymbosa]
MIMAADTKKYYCSSVFLIFVVIFMQSSYAYQFYVGGRAGWVVNPPEDYNHWAGRMRFQVNDTLFFKYEKGSNSVFEVNRDDYNQCNTNNPILKLEDGNSIFKFDRSGPFYFISGNKTLCDQGQKIITVVLAIRPPPPAPVTPAPPGQTPAPAPAPVSTPPAPAPAGLSPALTPASSPAPASSVSPSISPSPIATPPAAGGSNASTPETSPGSSPPVPSSGESPPSPPGSSGSSSSSPPSTPNGNTPANNESSSARPAISTTSTVLMSAVSLVFVATLGAPIF